MKRGRRKAFWVFLCLVFMMGCRVDEQKIKDFVEEASRPETEAETKASPETKISPETKASPETQESSPEAQETPPEANKTPPENPDAIETSAPKGQKYITGEWGTDTPENHGISNEQIDDFEREMGERPIRSALLVKDGSIVYEYYREGYSADTRFDIYSCTKSILSAATGIAIDQGYLAGTDAKLESFFPGITDADMKEITVGNLLSLTSGIEWTENIANGVFLFEWMIAENQVDYVLDRSMRNKPGEAYNYSSGDSHLLSATLTEVTGMSAKEYVSENLFTPIGIGDVMWWEDSQGISFGGFGIYMTARDAARVGQLYLNKGLWGEERIISEEWIEKSIEPQGPNAEYGYGWWIDVPDGGQEYQMYYAAGLGGQYILVVPDYQIVAVIMSTGVDDMSVIRLFQSFVDELEAGAGR